MYELSFLDMWMDLQKNFQKIAIKFIQLSTKCEP
jgi:hypothetical protein